MTLTSDKRIPVLIDCDPGADDMFMLIWSMIMHKRWYIDIVAITTSGWNVPAQATFENAIRACTMCGLDTKIGKWFDAKGAKNAAHIHGNDGIGWLSKLLPPVETDKVTEYNSHDLMIDTINEYGDELVILATWPLSNLAAIEKKHAGILKKVQKVVSMGGAFFMAGNVSPVAEFNYRYDPASADVVLKSGANLFIAPLDVTTQEVFREEDLEPVLEHINHEEHRKFMYELTEFTISTNMWFRETHYNRGFYVHDASTIGFLLYPHIYTGSFYNVQIEVDSPLTKGQTVVDSRNFPKTDCNAFIVLDMNKDLFLEAMTEDFKDFDFENPYSDHVHHEGNNDVSQSQWNKEKPGK